MKKWCKRIAWTGLVVMVVFNTLTNIGQNRAQDEMWQLVQKINQVQDATLDVLNQIAGVGEEQGDVGGSGRRSL